MEDYEEMLEKGKEEIPEDIGSEERFDIPEPETRKEGSKTVLENFSEIVEKFNRKKDHVSKYIQNELGTAGHVEESELILNGEFRKNEINQKIHQYANEYVFCPECGRPDTVIKKEKGVEILKCQACGTRNAL
ncbi:MAG: translation initiation factor IF-2 subunit beta [Candidatus Nanohaloarchaea archaeon]